MRQIIFRGKRVDNKEWVEGVPIDLYGKAHIIIGNDFPVVYQPVNPSTVSQFTGLTDKNGKEIFEGDIISLSEHEGYLMKSFSAVVRWIESYASFGYNKEGLNEFGFEHVFIYPFSEHDEFEIDVLPYIEVIGSIHDKTEPPCEN